jgi:Thioredoxin domain
MKNVKVLGSGCKRCVTAAEMVQKAADKLSIPVNIEKVTDYVAIVSYGIASTPGIVVDGIWTRKPLRRHPADPLAARDIHPETAANRLFAVL